MFGKHGHVVPFKFLGTKSLHLFVFFHLFRPVCAENPPFPPELTDLDDNTAHN